jgi:hypothetical protein
MNKLFLILTLHLLTSSVVYSCCGEKIYRLFPIGELDNKVVCVEFDLDRNCDMSNRSNGEFSFWTKGIVRLVTTTGDSLTFLQTVDTFDIVDCQCSYENYYKKTTIEAAMSKSYIKALELANKHQGFQRIEPQKVVFNDTINLKIIEAPTDTTFAHILNYDNLLTINIGDEGIMSCVPDKVSEARFYKTKNYTITVVRMRCFLLDEKAIKYNKKRFKKIETAFWKEEAQWHGFAKDYFSVKAINN